MNKFAEFSKRNVRETSPPQINQNKNNKSKQNKSKQNKKAFQIHREASLFHNTLTRSLTPTHPFTMLVPKKNRIAVFSSLFSGELVVSGMEWCGVMWQFFDLISTDETRLGCTTIVLIVLRVTHARCTKTRLNEHELH